MTQFVPPTWTVGRGDKFHVTASAVASRAGRFGCPAKVSLGGRKIAKTLQPNDATRWWRTWDPTSRIYFALRDASDAVDTGTSIEAAAADDPRLTTPQRRFLVHALHQLQDVPDAASYDAGCPLEVGPDVELSGSWGTLRTNGVHLVSADGKVREVVRLRYKGVKGMLDPGHDDFVATSCWVLARGEHPHHVGPPERVRVSEFSLADGTYQVLFDGDAAQAQQTYRDRGWPVQEAMADQGLNPGSQCADCDFLNVCPAVPKIRGVLGLPDRAVATRAVTAADLTAYDRCPTAFHVLRRAHLPPAPPDGGHDSVDGQRRDRGLAAHAWLRWAHERDPRRGCTPADLPDPGAQQAAASELAVQIGVSVESYAVAWPYLRQHPERCLLGFGGLSNLSCEPLHVVYDPDADMVVVTEPDLTATLDSGGVVWRETKTSESAPSDVEDALHRHPGFALNVALLASGADGDRDAGGAELEVLTPRESVLYYVSLDDGALVSQAQRIIAEIGHAMARDLRYEPRPSGACNFCDAYGWCLPPERPARPAPEFDDDEFTGVPDPF
ncbi:MAG: PD-(D/E)XK nuclease family protein [Jiangellaceae bacterium]